MVTLTIASSTDRGSQLRISPAEKVFRCILGPFRGTLRPIDFKDTYAGQARSAHAVQMAFDHLGRGACCGRQRQYRIEGAQWARTVARGNTQPRAIGGRASELPAQQPRAESAAQAQLYGGAD